MTTNVRNFPKTNPPAVLLHALEALLEFRFARQGVPLLDRGSVGQVLAAFVPLEVVEGEMVVELHFF